MYDNERLMKTLRLLEGKIIPEVVVCAIAWAGEKQKEMERAAKAEDI